MALHRSVTAGGAGSTAASPPERRGKPGALTSLAILLVASAAFAQEVTEYFPPPGGRWELERTILWRYVSSELPDVGVQLRRRGEAMLRRVDVGAEVDVDYEGSIVAWSESGAEVNLDSGERREYAFETLLGMEPDRLLLLGVRERSEDGEWPEFEIHSPPLVALQEPLWRPREAASSTRRHDGMIVEIRPYDVASVEVDVPAGPFGESVVVRSRGEVSGHLPESPDQRIQDGSTTESLWFVRGVGLVKQIRSQRLRVANRAGNTYTFVYRDTMELLAFRADAEAESGQE